MLIKRFAVDVCVPVEEQILFAIQLSFVREVSRSSDVIITTTPT